MVTLSVSVRPCELPFTEKIFKYLNKKKDSLNLKLFLLLRNHKVYVIRKYYYVDVPRTVMSGFLRKIGNSVA